jgi:uroporphyrinogen decarboxylase
MLPRERVQAAIDFRAPDIIPLRVSPAAGGLFEHGEKLAELHRSLPHDFGDLSGVAAPAGPAATDYDPDGRYHSFQTDAWGTKWEYRIYGIWGHPVEWPLDDLSRLDSYEPPAAPPASGPGVDAARESVAAQKATWYTLGGGGQLFEQLRALRRYEDALMDIGADTPEINRIADMVTEHCKGCVAYSLAVDVDGVAFGDDHGTQDAMICSPAAFRRFFRPRYEAIFEPVRRAGKPVFFHVCGQISPVLADMKELGVDVIWPQLNAYDLPELIRVCRDLELCVELHPDRGELMQRGTPGQIRDHVLGLVEQFDSANGGSWLYLEVDPGFPWENVAALFEVARELRGG